MNYRLVVSKLQLRFSGVEPYREEVEGGAVALVKVHLVPTAGDDDVPRVDGARRAHERGEDGVRGEHVALLLVLQAPDDGVVRGGHLMVGVDTDTHRIAREKSRGESTSLPVKRLGLSSRASQPFSSLALFGRPQNMGGGGGEFSGDALVEALQGHLLLRADAVERLQREHQTTVSVGAPGGHVR
eukprot:1182285-Prorocentrum_minimum.AAC.8